jgi:hypothetical protein
MKRRERSVIEYMRHLESKAGTGKPRRQPWPAAVWAHIAIDAAWWIGVSCVLIALVNAVLSEISLTPMVFVLLFISMVLSIAADFMGSRAALIIAKAASLIVMMLSVVVLL